MICRLQIPFLFLCLGLGAAEGDSWSLRVGTYSLERAESSTPLLDPPCGDEAKLAFSDVPRLTVVYTAKPESALVNGQDWIILKNRSGTFAAKPITSCTSFTLKFRANGDSATGTLVYVSKCPDGKQIVCASAADYAGTFAPRPSP
jgi:hypothetical protein